MFKHVFKVILLFVFFILLGISYFYTSAFIEYYTIYEVDYPFVPNCFDIHELRELFLYEITIFINLLFIAIILQIRVNRIISCIAKMTSVIFFLFMMADLFSITEFAVRLDIKKSIGFMDINSDSLLFLKSFFSIPNIWFTVILFILLLVITVIFHINKSKKNECQSLVSMIFHLLAGTFVLILVFFISSLQDNYKYKDWLELNISATTLNNKYSSSYEYSTYDNHPITYDGKATHKNVIVVIVESLSSYMSKEFNKNGLGYTPYLDELSKKSIKFNNYSCAASASFENFYTIMTGYPYIHNNEDEFSYKNGSISNTLEYRRISKKYFKHNIIKIFRDNGYDVAVFHGGELVHGINYVIENLADTADFVNIDSSSRDYQNIKDRYIFNSVSDASLYNNVLSYVNSKHDNPYIYFVLTFSSHKPYQVPSSKTQSLEKVMKYSDDAINSLIEELNQNNFFKDGILVITGDHRAMEPMNSFEKRDVDSTSIPLIIKDSENNDGREISNRISHQSLGVLLQYLTLDKVIQLHHQANPLLDSKENEIVIYRKYTPSNELLIINKDESCSFIMAGDKSDFNNCMSDEILSKSTDIKKFVYYLSTGCL